MDHSDILLSVFSRLRASMSLLNAKANSPKTGGGYVLPASPEMFLFYFQLISRIESAGKSAAVLFLSYGISLLLPLPQIHINMQ